MSEAKSTSEVRLIASDVVQQQAQVCMVKMANVESKLDLLTKDVAALTTTVGDLTTSVAVLKVRLTISAAVGGSLPVLVVLAWWWFTK